VWIHGRSRRLVGRVFSRLYNGGGSGTASSGYDFQAAGRAGRGLQATWILFATLQDLNRFDSNTPAGNGFKLYLVYQDTLSINKAKEIHCPEQKNQQIHGPLLC